MVGMMGRSEIFWYNKHVRLVCDFMDDFASKTFFVIVGTFVAIVVLMIAWSGVQNVNAVLTGVLNMFLSIVGVLAMTMLVWSGIKYILSHGSQEAVTSAKKTLMWALIGFTIVLTGPIVVKYIVNLFQAQSIDFVQDVLPEDPGASTRPISR